MEWKKLSKSGHSRKSSAMEVKKTPTKNEKTTKRRLKSKHRKMLTEGVNNYFQNSQLAYTSPIKMNKSMRDDTTVCERTMASFSKSYHHCHSNSVIGFQLEQFGRQFQKQNDRLRGFLDDLQLKNKKMKIGHGQSQKEGIAQKIKKQNILLKSTMSMKRGK